MIEIIQFYKTLSLIRKIQTVRILALIQVVAVHLVWLFVTSFQVRFYLETWVGLSWFLVIVLLLVEITYDEVKSYDQ